MLGFALGEKLEEEKFVSVRLVSEALVEDLKPAPTGAAPTKRIAPHIQKKRSIASASQPDGRSRNRSSFLRPASTLMYSRSHAKIAPDAQLVKISNTSGVRKLRCPAKQQPNSIDSKPLITYNLKKEEGRRKKEEVQRENLLTVGYGCYNSPSC
ncbi:hypothetical protein C7B67_27095 [filamentous cyanobacterium Phorm 6]|nr:hypothetical protein C7B67_27095 [filamentous cyanobacterium Phorm 6]